MFLLFSAVEGINHGLRRLYCTARCHGTWSRKYRGRLLEVAGIRSVIETKTKAGFTTLHLAVCKGYVSIVAQLIANPTVMNFKDRRGRTALHYAAQLGHEKIVALLLPTAILTSRAGYSALHMAARSGHDNIVATLLAQSPDLINGRSQNGRTPLPLAAQFGHSKIVSRLLAERPDLTSEVDMWKQTALHCCRVWP